MGFEFDSSNTLDKGYRLIIQYWPMSELFAFMEFMGKLGLSTAADIKSDKGEFSN